MLKHRLLHGDLTRPETVAKLMAGERAALVYSDPPWGPGNLKYWRTCNGETLRPDWPDFLQAFCSAVTTYCDGWVFVEMGYRWAPDLAAAMAGCGWQHALTHEMDYGRPARPQFLLGFHRHIALLHLSLPRWCWEATARVADFAAEEGAVLLDPCLGLGKSASLFAERGMRVFGMELNATRLAKAQRALSC